MKLRTDKVLTVVTALLLLTAIFIFLLSLSQSRQVNESARRVIHTQQVLINAEKLLQNVINNEKAARGFILSGQKDFLELLEHSEKEISINLSLLKILTADNIVQKERMDSLSFYIEKKIRFSDNASKAGKVNDETAIASLRESSEGKIHTDKIAAIIHQIIAAENETLIRQTEASEERYPHSDSILVIIIISILAMLFFIKKLKRSFTERKDDTSPALSNLLQEREHQRSAMHVPSGITSNMTSLAEQKKQEEQMFRMQQLYLFISQINQMIVRTTDEASLFREACRIAVEQGKFRMASIGMINEKTQVIVSAAQVSDNESNFIAFPGGTSVMHNAESTNISDIALRQDKYIVVNDIESSSEKPSWKSEAIKSGCCSFLSLPVKKYGKVTGVFSLFNAEKNFFDASVTQLLQETAGDIGFALEIFEKETLRKKAAEAISLSEEKYRSLIEHASDGIFIADENGTYTEVNDRGCQLVGYSKEEIIGLNIKDMVVIDENFIPLRGEELRAGKTVIQKRKLKKKDGSGILVEISGSLLPDGKMLGIARDLTERIEAEQTLQKEKELSDKIINSLPGIFYLNDSSPRMLRWNKALEEISGYTKEELQKIVPLSLFDPDDMLTLRQAIEKTYRQGSADVEARLVTKNSQTIPFYFTGTSINYNGKQAMLGTGIDISERKKAALKLEESEEKYRILFYNNPMPCFVLDTATSAMLDVNEAALELYGYSRYEFLLLNILSLLPAEEYERYRQHILLMAATPAEGNIGTWKHLKKNETLIDVEINVHTIQYDNRPCRMILVNNITDRKKAEEDIIREKNLSDSIINSLPGIFYLYNKKGKFLRWNNNFEIVSGYSSEEIKNMHPLDFFSEEEKEMLHECITDVFISGEANVQANLLTRAFKKIPYYFTGIAITYQDTICLMGVGIDFSERVQAQEEIKETSEQLRRLTAHLQNIREEERKRIGREIHDELGQQLTAIKMDVAWVNKKIPEEAIVLKNKLLNVIKLLDGSNHSIRRILSELRPSILDDHGLPEAIEWLGNQFTLNTGIPVIFTTSETTLKLPGNIATSIFRIYQEALTNITRYASAGTVLTSLQIAGVHIIFTVEDDGRGFDTSGITQKRSFGILGMKERILLINGKFEITSLQGEGTKIIITIPLADNS